MTEQSHGGMPLFAYGSLMFAPVIEFVIGRVPECCPAIIEGYRRLEVVGEVFPGIIKESGGDKVEGVLYANICEAEWQRLTAFEDDFYEIEQVSVFCRWRREASACLRRASFTQIPSLRKSLEC